MFWNLYLEGIKLYQSREDLARVVVFDNSDEAKERFEGRFNYLYDYIYDKYMMNTVRSLDRHKTGAIAAISIADAELIAAHNKEEDEVFVGDWMIAINIGLTYLLAQLNDALHKYGQEVDKLYMPPVFSCPRPYPEVMERHLFYNQRDGGRVSPLDLAEKFYLLECLTLERNNIGCEILAHDD